MGCSKADIGGGRARERVGTSALVTARLWKVCVFMLGALILKHFFKSSCVVIELCCSSLQYEGDGGDSYPSKVDKVNIYSCLCVCFFFVSVFLFICIYTFCVFVYLPVYYLCILCCVCVCVRTCVYLSQ